MHIYTYNQSRESGTIITAGFDITRAMAHVVGLVVVRAAKSQGLRIKGVV